MKHALLFSIVATLLSCKSKEDTFVSNNRDSLIINQAISHYADNTPEILEVKSKENAGLITSKLISDDHKIIKLETSDACLIGEISKVMMTGDRILILDRGITKRIFSFTRQGKFLKIIGKKGGGPGEMDDPRDFEVINQNIYITDRQCRVFKFDQDGNYLTYFRLPFLSTQFCGFSDDNFFFYNRDRSNPYSKSLVQTKGFKSVSSLDFSIQSEFVSNYGVTQAFSRNGNQALFVKFLCDTIFQLDNEKIIPAYVLKSSYSIPDDYYASIPKVNDAFTSAKYWKLANQNFATTTNSVVFSSVYQNLLYYHFFDKETKKHVWFNRHTDDYFQGGIFAPLLVGVHDEYFIYTLSMAGMVATYKNILKENNSDILELKKAYPMLTDFFDLAGISKEDDNPALLLTKINNKLYEE